jgi:hypothetical protein
MYLFVYGPFQKAVYTLDYRSTSRALNGETINEYGRT